MNAQTKIHRPLANIICDLQAINMELAQYYSRPPGRVISDEEHDEWDALDTKRENLEREFTAAFRAQTGLSWSQCSDAMS